MLFHKHASLLWTLAKEADVAACVAGKATEKVAGVFKVLVMPDDCASTGRSIELPFQRHPAACRTRDARCAQDEGSVGKQFQDTEHGAAGAAEDTSTLF